MKICHLKIRFIHKSKINLITLLIINLIKVGEIISKISFSTTSKILMKMLAKIKSILNQMQYLMNKKHLDTTIIYK